VYKNLATWHEPAYDWLEVVHFYTENVLEEINIKCVIIGFSTILMRLFAQWENFPMSILFRENIFPVFIKIPTSPPPRPSSPANSH
jgi:hypothetical protein